MCFTVIVSVMHMGCTVISTSNNIKIIEHNNSEGTYMILKTLIEDTEVIMANICLPTKIN